MLKVQAAQAVEKISPGDSTCNTSSKFDCLFRMCLLTLLSKLLTANCININLTRQLFIPEERLVSEGPRRAGEITLEGRICNTRTCACQIICLFNCPINVAKRLASVRGEGTRYPQRCSPERWSPERCGPERISPERCSPERCSLMIPSSGGM